MVSLLQDDRECVHAMWGEANGSHLVRKGVAGKHSDRPRLGLHDLHPCYCCHPGDSFFRICVRYTPCSGCSVNSGTISVWLPCTDFRSAPDVHLWVTVVGAIIFVGTWLMLAMTSCGDPGYLPKQSREELSAQKAKLQENGTIQGYTLCQVCQVYRPQKARHCQACNACVLGLGKSSHLPSIHHGHLLDITSYIDLHRIEYYADHHCPWHGKCIG